MNATSIPPKDGFKLAKMNTDDVKTPSPDTQMVLDAFKISPNRALAQAEVGIIIDLSRKKIDGAFNWLTVEGYIVECPLERYTLLPAETQGICRDLSPVEAMTTSRYRLI